MAVHILDAMTREGFEEVVALHDRRSGLRGFVALHDTSAGPAFGGIRRFAYRNENQALADCLRLARSMSHKCALNGIAGGGGKMVLFDPPEEALPAAYRAIGEFVERLGGRWFTGPDVGTGLRELGWVAERTSFVARPDEGPGDLATATAAGVFAAMGAALSHLDGEERWPARTVVVQGLGRVGLRLSERLRACGARVVASEKDPDRRAAAEDLGLEVLEPGSELDVASDVFSPCAMGGVLHDLSIPRLRARVVCGAANNPLARTIHGVHLHRRGILFVPDPVANSGALLRGAEQHLSGRAVELEEIEARIAALTREILELAEARSTATVRVAEDEARRRIERRRATRRAVPAGTP